MWTGFYTFHAYRSWMPDQKEGYVQHGLQGIQERNEALAYYRSSIARGEMIVWDSAQQQALHEALRDVEKAYRGQLIAVMANPSHVHVLIQLPDEREAMKSVSGMKRRMTMELNELNGKPEVSWFTRRFHVNVIEEREHFEQLIYYYIPDHRKQNALIWIDPVYGIKY